MQTGPLALWLRSEGRKFIASVVSRPLTAAMYIQVVRKYIVGPFLYYGHDIHHERLALKRQLSALNLEQRWQRRFSATLEHRIWRQADVVLYPSEEEAERANAYRTTLRLSANAEVFPLWTPRSRAEPVSTTLEERSGMLFVGSHAHAPNVDGLDWFLNEVMPLLQASGEKPLLTVVGSGMEAYRPPAAAANFVRILGQVDDPTLHTCYDKARLVVAPLRFGGGVKGKVLEAIEYGVPCVMTSVAAQGLSGIERFLPVNDEPFSFAAAIRLLQGDDDAWNSASLDAFQFLVRRYDHSRYVRRLRFLLTSLPRRPYS